MRLILFLISPCLFLTACKVGPNYHPPEVVMPLNFVENRPDETVEVSDENLLNWWGRFNDPFLDDLLDVAIRQNFDYRIALEKVYQARAQYWVQFTQILPEFDAASVASHFRTSQSFGTNTAASAAAATVSPVQNFYQVGIDAIWQIDIFGKFRRNAASAYDLWEASADDLIGVKLTVISEVASTYATICSYQKKKDIAEQVVKLDEELLLLSQGRFKAGLANEQEVEAALAALESDKAQLNLTESALKQTIYSLATLLGRLPEEVIANFRLQRPILKAEGKVPIAVPSELLRRRPDIRSAERQLASSTEQVGVAVADLFPTLSLTGSSSSFAANPLQGANAGFSSNSLDKLFRPASAIWGIGGFVTAPVFDFGKRRAAVDVQIALRNQAYYTYQKTVIAALQETEQALQVYFNDEKREKSISQEVEANWKILTLTTDQFQAGLANYTQVLQAKETWLASSSALTDSQQALTTDLIAIYLALGGDW